MHSGDVASGPGTTPVPGQTVGPLAASPPGAHHAGWFWLWVMCLVGVDYFSTLGYQPSIAFANAGLLAPLATVVLVLVTLFGALPVYAHVAAESPQGQGSISMLERLLRGWTGKFIVLTLLGFAATDFVLTKTLSAADAAKHLIGNPFWQGAPAWSQNQIIITLILLVVLGATFMRGFGEVLGLAVAIVGAYLLLNAIILVSAISHLAAHPQLVTDWHANVMAGNWHLEHPPLAGHDWWTIIAVSILLFPRLALGLSGFETGVLHTHLVKGSPEDQPERPRVRIRNTRKLLVAAAVIMSAYLLSASLATTMLIPPQDLQRNGRAYDRALAYLAHGQGPHQLNPLFGEAFGTVYDLSAIVILWFAGASAMSGLLNMVPQYLPRYGMAPEWTRARRLLVILFTAVNLFVTWIFSAEVDAQANAYATGVIVLMASSCIATFIHIWRMRVGGLTARLLRYFELLYFGIVTLVFLFTTVDIIITKPDGILISACFIAGIMFLSMISRTLRSTELRFGGFQFVDEQSRFLWDSMKFIEFPVLVPHRPGSRELAAKEKSIREEHRLSPEIPIVFIEAELGDVSEFYQSPLMEVKQEEGTFIIHVTRCNSIAHVIAALGLELSKVGKPPEIHFGWSNESPLAASVDFVLFGEGNIPWMVRQLIMKAEPDPARQPRIIVG